jgi:hypothetical protein
MQDYTYKVDIPITVDDIVQVNYVRITPDEINIGMYYQWDGANGIWDSPKIMMPSLVHDAFCQHLKNGNLKDTKKIRYFVDCLLYKMCIDNGMWKFKAGVIFYSVRWFSKFWRKKRK